MLSSIKRQQPGEFQGEAELVLKMGKPDQRKDFELWDGDGGSRFVTFLEFKGVLSLLLRSLCIS